MSAPRGETVSANGHTPAAEPDAGAAAKPPAKPETDAKPPVDDAKPEAADGAPEAEAKPEAGVTSPAAAAAPTEDTPAAAKAPEANEPSVEGAPEAKDAPKPAAAEPVGSATNGKNGTSATNGKNGTSGANGKLAAATEEPPTRPSFDDDQDDLALPILPPIQPSRARQTRRIRLLVTLGVAAVVLLAATVVAAVGALTARDSGARANQAFVDTAATAEVAGQVTDAITTVYSYDYNSLPANEAAAKAVITGKFADEFGRVFEPVKQLAPAQQAVLRTTVRATGVSLLQDDRARLLMMVDQAGVRGAAKEPTGATARLVVDAKKVDGRWKIAEVTPE